MLMEEAGGREIMTTILGKEPPQEFDTIIDHYPFKANQDFLLAKTQETFDNLYRLETIDQKSVK